MTIQEALDRACQLIIAKGIENLNSQGHNVTGDLIRSLESKVYNQANDYIGEISGLKYGLAQETGFKPNSNRGGSSFLWVANLMKWLTDKGLVKDITKAHGVAFVVMRSQINKGMHTRNGNFAPQYQNWLSNSITETQSEVDKIIEDAMDESMQKFIDSFINESLRNV